MVRHKPRMVLWSHLGLMSVRANRRRHYISNTMRVFRGADLGQYVILFVFELCMIGHPELRQWHNHVDTYNLTQQGYISKYAPIRPNWVQTIYANRSLMQNICILSSSSNFPFLKRMQLQNNNCNKISQK